MNYIRQGKYASPVESYKRLSKVGEHAQLQRPDMSRSRRWTLGFIISGDFNDVPGCGSNLACPYARTGALQSHAKVYLFKCSKGRLLKWTQPLLLALRRITLIHLESTNKTDHARWSSER